MHVDEAPSHGKIAGQHVKFRGCEDTFACLIISATDEQFLVCAASEDFPHRLLDDNGISMSDYNGCTDVNMQRS